MRGSSKFFQRGSNSFYVVFFFFFFIIIIFLVNERRDEMAFRWRVDDGPTLNSGLVAL